MNGIRVYVPAIYEQERVRERETQRIPRPHDCEACGHHMEWDDQECGCSARDPWLNR